MSEDPIQEIHARISFPTCEDLGIPRGHVTQQEISAGESVSPPGEYNLSPGGADSQYKLDNVVQINGVSYDPCSPRNPFSPFSRIPVPGVIDCIDLAMEPAFIRKRNERERERVRCVNEGYARLREHLPLDKRDKRISKVETLKFAISYIGELQDLLNTQEDKVKGDKCHVVQGLLNTRQDKVKGDKCHVVRGHVTDDVHRSRDDMTGSGATVEGEHVIKESGHVTPENEQVTGQRDHVTGQRQLVTGQPDHVIGQRHPVNEGDQETTVDTEEKITHKKLANENTKVKKIMRRKRRCTIHDDDDIWDKKLMVPKVNIAWLDS